MQKHPEKRDEYRDFIEQIFWEDGKKIPDNLDKPYITRCKFRQMLINEGKPVIYDRLVLLYVSVTVLNHYREDVTVQNWLERKEVKIAETTFTAYTNMFETHIKPYFSEKKIKLIDLKPLHLEEYYTAKQKTGLSPNTILKHHSFMHTVLKDALKNEFIKYNPAALADKPKHTKPEHDYYSEDELKQLLSVTKDTRLELPVFLAVTYGLRRSECIGLKWSSIDFNARTISICNKVTKAKKSGKWIELESKQLKSEASNCTFYMNDAVCNYLKEIKQNQDSLIRETDQCIDYVCEDDVGNRIKTDYIRGAFPELLKKSNMRHIRFHNLRHSCISLLVKNNFNMKTIQEYARHADFTLTANTYSHVELGAKRMEIDSITDALFPMKTPDTN